MAFVTNCVNRVSLNSHTIRGRSPPIDLCKNAKVVFTFKPFYVTKKRETRHMEEKNKRPWGHFEVLSDAPNHKVKRIVVEPGGILSLQRHKLRSEHWFVVSGTGIASVDGKDYCVQSGSVVDIPSKTTHRLKNSSAEILIIIEVQTGEYFGEDDIERLEDKYGRV